MSDLSFFDWLMKQAERDDDVGEFASDVRYHRDISLLPTTLHEDTDIDDWVEYLNEKMFNTSSETVNALREAWDEYQSDDPFKNTPSQGQSALDF